MSLVNTGEPDQHVGKGGRHPLLPIQVVVTKMPALSGVGLGCFRIMGRSHRKVEQSELAKEGSNGLCSDVSELTVPRSDQAEAGPPLAGLS